MLALQAQCGSCHVCSRNGSLIQVPASQLIDESKKLTAIRFWHDQIFSKPAHHGGVVAWSVHTGKKQTCIKRRKCLMLACLLADCATFVCATRMIMP